MRIIRISHQLELDSVESVKQIVILEGDQMTPAEFLEKGKQIIESKGHDYTKDPKANQFENFEKSGLIGSWFDDPVDRAFAVLIGTKLARLATLLNGKSPKNESIEDTFLDMMNYAALWGGNQSAKPS